MQVPRDSRPPWNLHGVSKKLGFIVWALSEYEFRVNLARWAHVRVRTALPSIESGSWSGP